MNPTLRLRSIINLISLLIHLHPKEKAKKKKAIHARHFLIWDTGASSSLIDDHHRFFLRIDSVIGADMIIWKNDNLYESRDGQEVSLETLRKLLPAELVGTLMLMLAAKQEKNKRGKKSGGVIQTTIDAEIPTEEDGKIIQFPHAA